MQKKCDICGGLATLAERVVENGNSVEYAYCQVCYDRAIKNGVLPRDEAKAKAARRGRECSVCGYSAEEFEASFLFGCPDCYRTMPQLAASAVQRAQSGNIAKIVPIKTNPKQKSGFKSADDCSIEDLVRDNVISSRIRLARNINGLEFTHRIKRADKRIAEVVKGAARAAQGVFDASVHTMASLSDLQKKLLLERHLISLPLANNVANGAVVLERGARPQMSIMIGEEDAVREQCVTGGHSLAIAYGRIKKYDDNLAREFEFAVDSRLGYLTACPTNVGTGMRASEMLFLPALRRTGAIDDALKTFKEAYGLTVRGYFGEGSGAAYDTYQISNTRTLGVTEQETLNLIEQAVLKLCYCERVALERLVRDEDASLFNSIGRSYGVLTGAYSLTAPELMKLIADVKLGVILGVLPIKSTAVLNRIIEECTSSLDIINEDISASARDKTRADIARRILSEER